MNKSFTPFRPNHPASPSPVGAPCTAIYTHPDDVACDPNLTKTQKRAVLASWISDARAVENSPTLRRLDSGAVIEVDAILRALALLDELAPEPKVDRSRPSLSPRRRTLISRWLQRVGPSNSSNDNDDDPPPAPAGLGIQFRRSVVPADSEYEKDGRLALKAGRESLSPKSERIRHPPRPPESVRDRYLRLFRDEELTPLFVGGSWR
jgi:hypothetical protein